MQTSSDGRVQRISGKLPLFPGMPEEFRDMDELYVRLQLVETQNSIFEPEVMQHEALFALKDKKGNALKRILIRAGPGGGKTAMVSKIAYDWSKDSGTTPGNLRKCKLLFALDLREVHKDMSLIDAIQDQCLPDVSEKGLLDFLRANAGSISFLLDGFDEAHWLSDRSLPNSNQFRMLLRNKWLQDSLVIVTTRPHRVSNYIDTFGMCTQVQILGFREFEITEYVAKFFGIPAKYFTQYEFDMSSGLRRLQPPANLKEKIADVDSLLGACVTNRPKERIIAYIPILLTMLCMLWVDLKSLPEKITEVFEAAITYLARHRLVKIQQSDTELDDETLQEQELQNILIDLGEIALIALLEDDQKARLIFQEREFYSKPGLLSKATALGIISKERTRSKTKLFKVQSNISFLHKTFQEFCAAKYLATLEEIDREKFGMFLTKVTSSNIDEVTFMMQFCCGLSVEAGEIILSHFVSVLNSTTYPYNTILDCSLSASNNPWTPALLLFCESKEPILQRHLQSLFEISSIKVTLGNHGERLSALDYFLDCRLTTSDMSQRMFSKLYTVDLSLEVLSSSTLQIGAKFLACTPNVHSLQLTFPSNISAQCPSCDNLTKSIVNKQELKQLTLGVRGLSDYAALLESFNKTMTSFVNLTVFVLSCSILNVPLLMTFLSRTTNLKTFSLHWSSGSSLIQNHPGAVSSDTKIKGILQCLKQLTLDGSADFTPFIMALLANKANCVNLKSLTLSCTTFCVMTMKRFLFQLRNLRMFCLEGQRKFHGRKSRYRLLDSEHVADMLLNALVSTQLRSLSIIQYHVSGKSLQPLLSRLFALHLENLHNLQWDEILSALYDTSKKRFREFRTGKVSVSFQCKHLQLHKISVDSVSLLAKAFHYMPRLTVLNLSDLGLEIRDEGYKLIAHALPCLKSLQELNLSKNYAGEASTEIAKCLTKLPKLEKLLMKGVFNDEGIIELGKSFHHLPKIRILKLSYNCVFFSKTEEIFLGLQSLTCLQELNLRNSVLSDEALEDLPFQKLQGLTRLDIGGEILDRNLDELKEEASKLNAGEENLMDLVKFQLSGSQFYSPQGLKTVFRSLKYLKKLAVLEISYHEDWFEDPFWRQFCTKCLSTYLARNNLYHKGTLSFQRNEIEALSSFVDGCSS